MPVYQLPLASETPMFPLPHLSRPDGLLAVGGGLSVDWLITAYSMGIFPWYDESPILWWSPDPRMVLYPADFRVPRSTRRHIRRGTYRVTIDTAFNEVLTACAMAKRPDQEGTWINPAMMNAYEGLFARGVAHSVEVWRGDELVGGLYGVAIGALFCGESMFALADDASKVAFATLVPSLEKWGYKMIDCQMHTDHLARFGAKEIERAVFLTEIADLVVQKAPVGWDL